MPKKEKKEKKEKLPKVDSGIAELSNKMDSVIGGLSIVGNALSKLVELQTEEKKSNNEDHAGQTQPNVTKKFVPKMDDETYPQQYVPPKYRQIVTELLSEEFGITVTDFEDRTDFQVNIVVPEKYSSVSKEDREKGVEDIRSRMIPRALGENGVREWCSLIRQNLNKYYTQSGHASPFNR